MYIDPHYFWLLLVGQGVSSVTNLIEWSAPSLVSAVWFPPNERAFATASVGATAPQVQIPIHHCIISYIYIHMCIGWYINQSIPWSYYSTQSQY